MLYLQNIPFLWVSFHNAIILKNVTLPFLTQKSRKGTTLHYQPEHNKTFQTYCTASVKLSNLSIAGRIHTDLPWTFILHNMPAINSTWTPLWSVNTHAPWYQIYGVLLGFMKAWRIEKRINPMEQGIVLLLIHTLVLFNQQI